MIPINMTRKLKGIDKIKEYEKQYKNIENLKKLIETDNYNALDQLALENWEYFLKNPEEDLTESKTIFIEKGLNFTDTEYKLLQTIKEQKPKSISELANLTNKEVSTVQKKLNYLKKANLIDFEHGGKNRKIPIVNYDSIEIAI